MDLSRVTSPGTTYSNPLRLTRKISPRYKDEDADLIILSSDDVEFRVHSYHLLSSSPVFRETLRSGTGWEEDADSLPRIHLADKRIESSTVLTAALDCIYGGVDVKLPSSVSSNIDIIAFLRKYECQGTLDRVRFVLHRWAVEAAASDWFRAFLVSAATHDLDICRQAIRHGGSVMLEAWSPVVPEDATPRQKSEAQRNARLAADTCLDLGAMPLWMYKILPPEFAWAMQRVMRGRRMINTQAEWDLIGSEVVELLRNYDFD